MISAMSKDVARLSAFTAGTPRPAPRARSAVIRTVCNAERPNPAKAVGAGLCGLLVAGQLAMSPGAFAFGQNPVESAKNAAGNAAEKVKGAVSGNPLERAGNKLSNAADDAKDNVKGAANKAKNALGGGNPLDRAGNKLSNAAGDAKSNVKSAANQAKNALGGGNPLERAGDKISNAAGDAKDNIKGAANQAKGALGGGNPLENVGNKISNAAEDVKDNVQGAAEKAKNALGGNSGPFNNSGPNFSKPNAAEDAGRVVNKALGAAGNAKDNLKAGAQDAVNAAPLKIN